MTYLWYGVRHNGFKWLHMYTVATKQKQYTTLFKRIFTSKNHHSNLIIDISDSIVAKDAKNHQNQLCQGWKSRIHIAVRLFVACLFSCLLARLTSQEHGKCIPDTDLFRQLCVLPHWERTWPGCRSNLLSQYVTICYHRSDQFYLSLYDAGHLTGWPPEHQF